LALHQLYLGDLPFGLPFKPGGDGGSSNGGDVTCNGVGERRYQAATTFYSGSEIGLSFAPDHLVEALDHGARLNERRYAGLYRSNRYGFCPGQGALRGERSDVFRSRESSLETYLPWLDHSPRTPTNRSRTC
jgi:hypothetical protein